MNIMNISDKNDERLPLLKWDIFGDKLNVFQSYDSKKHEYLTHLFVIVLPWYALLVVKWMYLKGR